VLSTGRTSELAAQIFLKRTKVGERHSANLFETSQSFAPFPIVPPTRTINLPEEAYVMMGDHIGYALQACQTRGFNQPIITCQFAKLLKIACGHENTHAAASELDLSRLLEWAQDSNLPQSILESIASANTAREIAITCSFDPAMLELVFQHARQAVKKHSPAVSPQFLVADYNGNCIFNSH
jgi:cobalt-precorrin-5B (C1)-methyltransferase